MKCPTDSIHITSYRVTGRGTCTLKPCGHTVSTLVSETTEPRAVALYGSVNTTTPGQDAGMDIVPTN